MQQQKKINIFKKLVISHNIRAANNIIGSQRDGNKIYRNKLGLYIYNHNFKNYQQLCFILKKQKFQSAQSTEMSKKTATNFMAQYIRFPNLNPPLVAPFVNQKITLPNPQLFYTKLNNIRNNSKQLQFVSDFDYTLTKFRHNNRTCDSLFGMWIRGDYLPKSFIQFIIANYRQFGPYQTDATISFQEKVHLVGQLYKFQTKAFQKFKITQEMAQKVLNNGNLVYRAFTNELLNTLQQFNIPLYIISGGISDSIHNSLYSLTAKQYRNISIHSNELQPYTIPKDDGSVQPDQKRFIRFRKDLVHSYNKYKVMNHVNKRKNCFLMGDLVSDIYMAQGNNYENILSIFYAKEGENDQRAHAQRKFDIIVEGDCSHRIIIELIKAINRSQDIDWQYLYSTKSNIHQFFI